MLRLIFAAGAVRDNRASRLMMPCPLFKKDDWMGGDPEALPVIANWVNGYAQLVLIAAFFGFCAQAQGTPDSKARTPASSEALDQARPMTAPNKEKPLIGNPLWKIALSALQETRARPIFSPSRRPPSPPVVAAPPAPAPKPPTPREPDHLKLTLLGTVIGASEGIGVFVDETSKDVIRIRTGASHDGWTLRSLQRRAASFEKDHQETTLVLTSPGSEQAAPSGGVITSSGANTSGNDRGAAKSLENRAQPTALILPASAPTTRSAHKIRQDILSIGVQN
jgi:general secretion pathway protein N